MSLPFAAIGTVRVKLYLDFPVDLFSQIIPGNATDSFTDTPATVEECILCDGLDAILSMIEDMPTGAAYAVFAIEGRPAIRIELSGNKTHRPAQKEDVQL